MKWAVYLSALAGLAILGLVCVHQNRTIAQASQIAVLSAVQCNDQPEDVSPTRLLLKAAW